VHAEKLDDRLLVHSARTQSQAHLLAISRRKSLSEAVTDVLVERGNREVVLTTTKNRGAKFSQQGFSVLIRRSDGDDLLALSVSERTDIPRDLFLMLLSQASEIVRSKLILEQPQLRREIQDAVATVTDGIRNETEVKSTSDPPAQALIRSLHNSGKLNDDAIQAFAEAESLRRPPAE
jgi:uncharacterized protein (DUF2336 family)